MKNRSIKNLKNLRLADLELFITAAHMQSLSKAAALHHLSQSAASAAIQRVEFAFDLPLCLHEKKQFGLTHEGKQFLPRAETWLKSLQEQVITSEVQPVRLATTHAIARVVMEPILQREKIDLKLLRPDYAYGAVLTDQADIALVLDNAPWESVIATEIAKGSFQLYSRQKNVPMTAVLLPEDQMEVLTLQEKFRQVYKADLSVKARLPSWSLIADICSTSSEVGFLPDFLGKRLKLHPVKWQPTPSRYRMLALYRKSSASFQERLEKLIFYLEKNLK